jgi:hypothetical protein
MLGGFEPGGLVADKAVRQQILGLVKHNDTNRQAAKVASVLIQLKDLVLAKRGDRTRTYPFSCSWLSGDGQEAKRRKGEKAG